MTHINASSRRMVIGTFIIALIVAAVVGAIGAFSFKSAADARNEEAAQQRDEQVLQLAKRVEANSTSKKGSSDLAIVGAFSDINQSDERYWMLVSDGLVLFVKNAEQTEQHRGKPAGDYVEAAGFQGFLSATQAGSVSRTKTTVQGSAFDVNATNIAYNGRNYQMALFTQTSNPSLADALGLPESALPAACAILLIIVAAPTAIAVIVARSRRRPAPAYAAQSFPADSAERYARSNYGTPSAAVGTAAPHFTERAFAHEAEEPPSDEGTPFDTGDNAPAEAADAIDAGAEPQTDADFETADGGADGVAEGSDPIDNAEDDSSTDETVEPDENDDPQDWQ